MKFFLQQLYLISKKELSRKHILLPGNWTQSNKNDRLWDYDMMTIMAIFLSEDGLDFAVSDQIPCTREEM